MKRALVIIDIQNDITKHYREIIHGVNTAIEWAERAGDALCVRVNHRDGSARVIEL